MNRIWRVTSMAAAALLLLSACSGRSQFAVVNQASEYSLVALNCDTLVTSIRVSTFDLEKRQQLPGQWTMTSTAPAGSVLPASGVTLGSVPTGFTEGTAPPSDLLSSGSVLIEVESNVPKGVMVVAFDLRPGEYQTSGGARGEWSALQAERGC